MGHSFSALVYRSPLRSTNLASDFKSLADRVFFVRVVMVVNGVFGEPYRVIDAQFVGTNVARKRVDIRKVFKVASKVGIVFQLPGADTSLRQYSAPHVCPNHRKNGFEKNESYANTIEITSCPTSARAA